MKTAKEMCELLEEKLVREWTERIFMADGKLSTKPNVYRDNYNNIFYKSYWTYPSEKDISILHKRGFKVKEFQEELPKIWNEKYKTVEMETGFWIFKRKVERWVFDKFEPELFNFKWVEISACCGSDESN